MVALRMKRPPVVPASGLQPTLGILRGVRRVGARRSELDLHNQFGVTWFYLEGEGTDIAETDVNLL
jgi:hypothetical protein